MGCCISNDILVGLQDLSLILAMIQSRNSHLVGTIVQSLNNELRADVSGGESGEGVIQLVHQHHDLLSHQTTTKHTLGLAIVR